MISPLDTLIVETGGLHQEALVNVGLRAATVLGEAMNVRPILLCGMWPLR
jgi:hypothetical protein